MALSKMETVIEKEISAVEKELMRTNSFHNEVRFDSLIRKRNELYLQLAQLTAPMDQACVISVFNFYKESDYGFI